MGTAKKQNIRLDFTFVVSLTHLNVLRSMVQNRF